MTIETGIPIPPPRMDRVRIIHTMRKMKRGQSAVYSGSRASIYTAARRLGLRVKTRARENASIRFWIL
jgi:hypothetical protein